MAAKIDNDDIRDAIERELDRMANQSAAQGRSHLDDQTMIDLDEKGYDDQSALYMAWFGGEFAVDSDILVSPPWYDLLDLKKPERGAQVWSEAETKEGGRADFALIDWARKNGYEPIGEMGGDWPGGIEAEIQVDFVVDAVRRETGASPTRILRVMRKEFEDSGRFDNDPPYGYIYWSSSDGEIEMYAKPREGETGEDEEDEEDEEREDNPRSCRKGDLLVRRKGHQRKAYTRRDGGKVATTFVPATSFCARDRGKPGRGLRVVQELREHKLGGPGYLRKSTKSRHRELEKCVTTYGYRSCLQSLQWLLLVGGEYSGSNASWSRKDIEKIKADKKWLMSKYGGEGSFGPRLPSPRHVRLARNLSW